MRKSISIQPQPIDALMRGLSSAGTHRTPRQFWLGHEAYWYCQLGGWTSLLIFSTWGEMVKDGTREPIGTTLSSFAVALLLSHAYRWIILWREWKDKSLWQLVPRILVASIIVSSLLLLLSLTTNPKALKDLEGSHPATLPMLVLSISYVYMMWSAIYFSVHYYAQLQEARLHQMRLDMSIKETALASLRAQVNPHFLFNGLNTLRELIETDPCRAREVVTQLAKVFRASLAGGSKHLISLREEIETVEAYLVIEKTRFEDRLQIEAAIAPETQTSRIPPFLLQTLIENAVKYGLATGAGQKLIRYETCLRDNILLIQVSNPGRLVQTRQSTGLGLKMTRERLNLLFDGQASLELKQTGDNLVIAEVRIPQKETA